MICDLSRLYRATDFLTISKEFGTSVKNPETLLKFLLKILELDHFLRAFSQG